MVSYTGVWSTCMKKALNSSNLYCWIHHIPQMVSLYITYNTAEPKHKRALWRLMVRFCGVGNNRDEKDRQHTLGRGSG